MKMVLGNTFTVSDFNAAVSVCKPKAKTASKAGKDQRTNPKDYPTYRKGTPSSKAFQEAYRKAKSNGQKTFTFEGRRYSVK